MAVGVCHATNSGTHAFVEDGVARLVVQQARDRKPLLLSLPQHTSQNTMVVMADPKSRSRIESQEEEGAKPEPTAVRAYRHVQGSTRPPSSPRPLAPLRA